MEAEYQVLAPINAEHGVYLIKNIANNYLCVKKEIRIFNLDVYRFLKENRVEGIPRVFEYEVNDGVLELIEEYVNGQDLQVQLDNGVVFKREEVLDIGSKLCRILNELNQKGEEIVHRDIKPSNVIYDMGKVYLLDFNAARIADSQKGRDTLLIGTEGYASPEQYGFGSSSLKSDIYSIGVLFKELCQASGLDDRGLRAIIEHCLMVDPKKRYRSFSELRFDFEHCSTYGLSKMLPVGFRSKKPLNMLIAMAVYGFIFCVSICMQNSSGLITWDLWLFRFIFMIIGILITQFVGNYLNCWELFGYKKKWPLQYKTVWFVLALLAVISLITGFVVAIYIFFAIPLSMNFEYL